MLTRVLSVTALGLLACVPVSRPATPESGVAAKVDGFQQSRESEQYVTVGVRFTNSSTIERSVTKYRISWMGGSKTIVPEDLVVPARGEITRYAKTTNADGNPLVDPEKTKPEIDLLEIADP